MNLFVFLALVFGCCGYALARGGAPERVAAGLQLAAFAIDEVVHRVSDGSAYTTLAIGSAVNDVVLLVALILLAWRSTRFWPLWLAGWQAADRRSLGARDRSRDAGFGLCGAGADLGLSNADRDGRRYLAPPDADTRRRSRSFLEVHAGLTEARP